LVELDNSIQKRQQKCASDQKQRAEQKVVVKLRHRSNSRLAGSVAVKISVAPSLARPLSQPTCVEQDKKDPDLNPAQQDIRQIQLVFSVASGYESPKEFVGKKVVTSGTLFGAHTAHHRTPVLLTVKTLTKAD
jgi:hypothetical protein